MRTRRLFYIIRHGETDYNNLGIVQGSGVDMPLNEKGIKQAGNFYAHYKNTGFKKIYCSALIRTQQTVQPFADNGHNIYPYAQLNEISWGVFEGKPQNEEERKEYWRIVNAWRAGEYDAKIRKGESAAELQMRQLEFINYLKNQEDDCVLICMHGRAMKSFLCTLLSLPLSEMERFEHSNVCLYVLDYDGEKFSIIKHKDTAHLAQDFS